jgi:hypothetical protein
VKLEMMMHLASGSASQIVERILRMWTICPPRSDTSARGNDEAHLDRWQRSALDDFDVAVLRLRLAFLLFAFALLATLPALDDLALIVDLALATIVVIVPSLSALARLLLALSAGRLERRVDLGIGWLEGGGRVDIVAGIRGTAARAGRRLLEVLVEAGCAIRSR